jgi:hypothetical protein
MQDDAIAADVGAAGLSMFNQISATAIIQKFSDDIC